MISIIQIILTSICASLFFNYIHNLHIKWGVNFKPFNCSSCLASWLAIALFFAPQLVVDICSIVFITGFLAPIIEFLIDKLLYSE